MTAPKSGGLARAFSALFGASAFSMAAQLVRGKLAAVLLGPAGVGIFNQLSVMWNLFQIGGSLGAFNGLVQHSTEALVADDRQELHRLASTWTLLLAAFSCGCALAGVIAAPALSDLLLNDGGRHAGLVALILLSIPFGVTSQVYRALLAASRSVGHLVKAQIASDLGAAVIFVALIFPFGLRGAVLGFMSTHLLFFLLVAASVRKVIGRGYVAPRPRDFRWSLVRRNIGFGASGIIMIALSNLAVLLVSRMIIGRLGIESSGIFSNAWRIASVYLGAVTATAISYYLPTLTRSTSNQAMSGEVNATLRFYLYLLPPVMALIMAGGEPIVWLILSRKFLPVAPLLLMFVPAELMRIMAETMSVPLLARRRILPFTLLSAGQAGLFIAGAAVLLPLLGLAGAAAAYAVATTAAAIATYVACRSAFEIRLEWGTAKILGRALALLIAVGLTCALLPFAVPRIGLCALLVALWCAAALRDDSARQILSRVWRARAGEGNLPN
jgi:PST family polysaccharide transporter